MIDIGQAKSYLVFHHILVNCVEFQMKEEYKSLNEESLRFGFISDIYESKDGDLYKITTTTTIDNGDCKDLYIKLVMSGYFGFQPSDDLEEEQKQHFIEKSTLAIMFPYIRSYITNLTAQSGGKPIIIPPININAIISKKE